MMTFNLYQWIKWCMEPSYLLDPRSKQDKTSPPAPQFQLCSYKEQIQKADDDFPIYVSSVNDILFQLASVLQIEVKRWF